MAQAQNPELPASLIRSYNDILDLKIIDARKTLVLLANGNQQHPFAIYEESLMMAIELMIGADEDRYQEVKKEEARLLDLAGTIDRTDPYHNWLKSEIKLQWAVVKLKFGDYWQAFWELRNAYNTIKKLHASHPEFEPGKKTIALLQVVFGNVPSRYQWAINLLGLSGHMDSGLAGLEEIYENGGVFSLEAGIWLSLINAYLLSDYDSAIVITSDLEKKRPQSLLIAFVGASVFMKNAQSEEALKILQRFMPPSDQYIPFPFTYYMSGEIMIQKGAYEASASYYKKFLESHAGPNNIKDAYFKISMCYWLSNDEATAMKYWLLADDHGGTSTDVDKNADYIISMGKMPQKQLLKARYNTDGGYFELAYSILSSIRVEQLSNHEDETQYYYRLARLKHKTTQVGEAELYYIQTISTQQGNNWYYAPNSCLQLAYMYRNRDMQDEARAYLERLLSYSDYPYESSIRNKAKLLLRQMNS